MRTRTLASSVAVLSVLAGLAACADDDAANDAPPPADDATTTLPTTDSASPDAVVEAAPDAADAAPRTCSVHGFCRTPLPPAQLLRGVWADPMGTVWSVSDGGSILRWDAAGWTVQATNAGESYGAVWGSSPTDVWVGGSKGLRHGTGATPATLVFAPVTTPGDATIGITSIWGTSATDIWAAGGLTTVVDPIASKGKLLHLASGVWKVDTTADPTATFAWSSVWGGASVGVWLAGNGVDEFGGLRPGLYRRKPGATTFAPLLDDLPPQPAGSYLAQPVRLDVGSATSSSTVLVLGQTHSPIGGFGAKPPEAASWHGSPADGGADAAAPFRWALDPRAPVPVPTDPFQYTAVWATAPNDIWAVSLSGRLRHFDGTSWTEGALTVTDDPEVTPLYGVSGRAANDFWIVGDQLAIHKAP